MEKFPIPDDSLAIKSDAAVPRPIEPAMKVKPPKPKRKKEVRPSSQVVDDDPAVSDVPSIEEVLSPPPLPRVDSVWEDFLINLPREVVGVLYESGLLTLDELLSKTQADLLYPQGKFSRAHLRTLQLAMAAKNWHLAELIPPKTAAIQKSVNDDSAWPRVPAARSGAAPAAPGQKAISAVVVLDGLSRAEINKMNQRLLTSRRCG